MNAPTAPRLGHARQFLAAGFTLLAVVVLMSVWFANKEREDSAAAQATLLNTQHLSDLLSTMRQAETGERAYMLTGDKSYLTTVYLYARDQVPGELQLLQASFGSGPQAAALAKVKAGVASKLNELAGSIALYQAGNLPAAVALMRNNINNHGIGRIRDLIGAMQASQIQQLARNRAEVTRSGWMLQLATLATVIAMIAVGWFAIRENRLQNAQLRAAEARLIATNEILEAKVAERTRTLQESEAALAAANTSLEARVAERSRELDRIFNVSTDVLAVFDFDRHFRSVSPAWTQITGWPAEVALSRPIHDVIHPDDLSDFAAAYDRLRGGTAQVNFETRISRADGGWCWLAWRGVTMPEDQLIYVVARDVTRDKAREEQLRQSQKMEVVGQLTGGIAHDFNNLLTVIMGSLELLQRDLGEAPPRLARRMEAAMGGARRAAALTHRLLAFSRQQPLAPQPLDVNRLIAGMSDMLHRTLGETIAIEVVSAAGIWQALADGNQLENAILNLAVNARDAMPAGGQITIETQNTYLDENYTDKFSDLKPGQYVMIAIADTGLGMSAAVKDKVFEPFFTTKPQGQGTGLGLAQVYGFIKQSGGHAAIYSEPGEGATVKLYLPRLRALPGLAAPEAESSRGLSGRGETILLVEDEDGVRDFSREVLEDHGYRVLAAENAAGALRLLDQHNDIAMLFTDVVLTGKTNGRELANQVMARCPGIVVLFTTGYTRNAIVHHGRLDDNVNFIGKPFTAAELGAKVQKLLERVRMTQD